MQLQGVLCSFQGFSMQLLQFSSGFLGIFYRVARLLLLVARRCCRVARVYSGCFPGSCYLVFKGVPVSVYRELLFSFWAVLGGIFSQVEIRLILIISQKVNSTIIHIFSINCRNNCTKFSASLCLFSRRERCPSLAYDCDSVMLHCRISRISIPQLCQH